MMKHLIELRDHFRALKHPAHKLGDFIVSHSNSPEYLVGVLGAFLKAAQADVDQEKATLDSLMSAFIKEQK